MNSTQDRFSTARNAVHQLRLMARNGDTEAVIALRELALTTADTLSALTSAPIGSPSVPESMRPGVAAAHQVATSSYRWPAALSAVKETRDAEIEAWNRIEVGSAIGIRLAGKRQRGMDYNEQTGFALDIFRELDAIRQAPEIHRHAADDFPELDDDEVMTEAQSRRSWKNLAANLTPLSAESLSEWTDAGVVLCRDWVTDFHGVVDWNSFPWPEIIATKASSIKDRITRDIGYKCGIEPAIREKIRQGFEKLLP